jgi:hypothetical protein
MNYLSGALSARGGQTGRIEQPDLPSVIPVDVVMRNLPLPEPGDDNDGYLTVLPCRRVARQRPINNRGVAKADHELLDRLLWIAADQCNVSDAEVDWDIVP